MKYKVVRFKEIWWHLVLCDDPALVLGTFAREGDARFAAHAMNCHVDLVSAAKGAMPYVSAACPFVDGKVTDVHALNRLEDLRMALQQVEGGGL